MIKEKYNSRDDDGKMLKKANCINSMPITKYVKHASLINC